MDNSQKIKQVYNDWSEKYDEHAVFNIAITTIHPAVINLLKNEPNKDKGLELGCGTGIMTVKASQFCKEIDGLDYSEGMLEKARQKQSLGGKMEFIQHDLHNNLPFDDEQFDFVLSVLTLHHLDSLENLYKEISRVLKPGGFFIFDEFITDNQTPEQLAHPFGVNYEDVLGQARESGVKIWNIRTIDEHRKLLGEARLKIEKIVDIKCDERIKEYVENFNYHKDRVIAKIVLARKI